MAVAYGEPKYTVIKRHGKRYSVAVVCNSCHHNTAPLTCAAADSDETVRGCSNFKWNERGGV